ncbi:hypothetical protein [Escherichia coli]|uniref:hypothetical protein n=2 Tax=Escherichia coli TaxID=562 RepID=UPI0021BA906C|nr:hypothetical protein [Escherichia coli]
MRCVCGKKIGPDPRNFNQRVSLGRNDLLIRTFLNTTEAFSCTEIDGMNCQTKNQFNYKDNSYVFVLERGGAWCYDYTVSVVNLKTGKAQMIEYGDNQLCSGSNKPFFEIKNGVPTVGVIDTSGKPVVVAQDKLKI